jgi:predicted MFS family arabinose efflux permease
LKLYNLMGVSQQHDPAPYRDYVDSFTTAATSVSNSSQKACHDETDNENDNENEDSSVRTAINDSNSNTPHLRLLDPAPVEDEQWVRDSDTGNTSDEDDPVHTAPSEKPVTWSSLPKKGQLAILTIARLSEPLTQTSLQAYLFYQLRSFDPSLPDSTISKQAGILQGSFTAAQFLTAVVWGRLADSEWIGRKRVLLIGLLGTCISCLGFGFSRSFAAAAVFRTLGGALNSNAGVMRTMISESIEEKKYQSRAFILLPMCFNIGVIIGPILGGLLADPRKNYPQLFGPGSFFGGEKGVWWMEHWPFLLPNLVSAIFIFISWVSVFFGLDETHEVARYRSDWGRRVGRRLVRVFRRRRYQQYRSLLDYPDGTSLLVDESIASRSLPPSPVRLRVRRRHKRPNFRQLFTRNVLLTLLVQFLLAFHTSAFNSMTFTFLPSPRAPKSSHKDFFRFGGGLGLSSSRVGLATAIIGIIGLPLQIFIYPHVQSRLGTLTSFRTFLPFSPLSYALMPFLVLVPSYPYLVWPAFTLVVALQVVSRTFALPAAVILVNNSVTDASILGTVNGVATSISSAARTLGPLLGGWGLGLGLKYDLVGGIWWALAVEALLGWVLLGSIYEGRGIDRTKDLIIEREEGERGQERR